MRSHSLSFLVLLGSAVGLWGQLLFTAGTDTNLGLFERINGQTFQINTGLSTHDFLGVSRDGRFATFSTPDVPQGNGIIPSSDLYVYDRATRTTRRIVNNFSSFDGAFQTWNRVLSSKASPGGQVIAYGVAISRALGGTGAQTTNELNIVDAATGLLISNPTGARGPTSDAFAAEFRGISFSPDGQSFVTPVYRYIGIDDPFPIELPTIVRFTRDPNSGQWLLAANLSLPQWSRNPQTFLASASVHTFPSLSPNGQGLAYFSLFVPDASTGTAAWTSRVVVANADGSNARLLSSFPVGKVPTGLTWTTDGTALVVSVADQIFSGTGFIPEPLRSTSSVFSVSTADGTTNLIPELGNGGAPSLPSIEPPRFDLSNTSVSLSRGSPGNVVFRASGVPDATLLTLQSSEGGLGNFRGVQRVNGFQLRNGLVIPLGEGSRFFRLEN